MHSIYFSADRHHTTNDKGYMIMHPLGPTVSGNN